MGYGERCVNAAAVCFDEWTDAAPRREVVARTEEPAAAYEPGQFWRRELPYLLDTIARIDPVETVVIDGYVWLAAGQPGLGAHLYEAIHSQVAVVGVAKTRYRGAAPVVEVLRGSSKNPLYITAVGMDVDVAALCVRNMHGAFRVPSLLARVDALSRTPMPSCAACREAPEVRAACKAGVCTIEPVAADPCALTR